MPAPTLHFWNWDAPVLHKAVAELTRGWKRGALDLSQTVILVPTSESVRRLREALAVAVAPQDGAIIAPHVWHPESALMHDADRAALLTPLQEQIVWRAVLAEIKLERFAALFPTEPAIARDAWAAGVAETLAKLRSATGAGGLSLADAAQRLSAGHDAVRWEQLATLEKSYLAKVAALGLCDLQEVKRARARSAALPAGVQRISVFALADPTPLLRQWLASASQQVPVDIFVHAPSNQSSAFDEWGAPCLLEKKNAVRLAPDLQDGQLHLAPDPPQQARLAIELLREHVTHGSSVALGLADPSLAPHFEGALSSEGVRAYDPAGRAASRHALLEVLRVWQRLAQSRTFRSLSAFLRLDDVLQVAAPQAGFTPYDLLETLDDFHQNRLPPTLDEALHLSALPLPREEPEPLQKLHALLQDIAARLTAWQESDPTDALRGLLAWIYGAREFATEAEDDRGYTFLFGEVMRLAHEAGVAARDFKNPVSASDLAQTVVRSLQDVQLPDTRGEIDLVLHGWLELLWEPADALVVCGFNDESVPGKIAPDPFLPDHVREVLGLSCQASRRARDAYLLAALTAQRKSSGALHLVIGQTNDAGDVLRPSRLLFACPDEVLPARIQRLFPREPLVPATPQPAHTIPWQLAPWRIQKKLGSISSSKIASYLRCPLRCGLEKFLGMSPVEAAAREMTPGDFGGLVHEVLALFGKDEKIRDSASEKEIRKFFDTALDQVAAQHWGSRPLLSTALQIDSARQRLVHAARLQADLRAAGWRILQAEQVVEKMAGLEIAGVPFSARLDRVDEDPQSGTIRVWDYKTRHKIDSPLDAHSRTVKASEAEDETQAWKRFTTAEGKLRQWTDLQLPLYVWTLRRLHPKAPRIEAGYIHLPTAVTESKIEIWDTLDEALIDSALSCAEEAVRRMKEGIFWPPTDEVRGDPFEEMLLGDPLTSVLEFDAWKEAPVA